jgi:hypothetical protein
MSCGGKNGLKPCRKAQLLRSVVDNCTEFTADQKSALLPVSVLNEIRQELGLDSVGKVER